MEHNTRSLYEDKGLQGEYDCHIIVQSQRFYCSSRPQHLTIGGLTPQDMILDINSRLLASYTRKGWCRLFSSIKLMWLIENGSLA